MALPRPVLVDLSSFLAPERVCLLPPGTDKAAALRALVDVCREHPGIADPDAFSVAIHERERVSSTAIGNGVAVPHAKLPSIDDFVIAVGICPSGIDFGARDEQPVHTVIMIAASDRQRENYLKVLATVASRLKDPSRSATIRSAGDAQAVIAALAGDDDGGE